MTVYADIGMHDTYQYLHIQSKAPPEDEQLVCSKHVEDVIRIKLKKLHLVGFIIQFITIHSQ